VVVHLTKRIDAYAYKSCNHNGNDSSYPLELLYNIMEKTEKAKGRLLYYYPLQPASSNAQTSEDSWIGWHNDSGFITALAGDMYVNDKTGEPVPCPDPSAGLYVEHKSGQAVHVNIPNDCMAVQLGECLQVLTGGSLVGTPHCVRGIDPSLSTDIARISFPCFVDSVPTYPLTMPQGMTREDILKVGSNTDKVPPLGERWTHDGMTFGDFLQKSIEIYYSWTLDSEGKEITP
jgi:isopenicillin N synthase-like dioxygenase